MVWFVQLPVLKIGVPLHSVIIDTLNKQKKIKREGVESDYVSQINIIEDLLKKLRVLGLVVVVVGHVVKIENT